MNQLIKIRPHGIRLTKAAQDRVIELMKEKEQEEPYFLRLDVRPRGCSDFYYHIIFHDDIIHKDDKEFDQQPTGLKVVVDMVSLEYVKGSIMDFQDTLGKSEFLFDNPNVTRGCPLGESFS